MNLAKISTNGQITLPADIRRRLGVGPGDKVLFVEHLNGNIFLSNPMRSDLAGPPEPANEEERLMAMTEEESVQWLIEELRRPRPEDDEAPSEDDRVRHADVGLQPEAHMLQAEESPLQPGDAGWRPAGGTPLFSW